MRFLTYNKPLRNQKNTSHLNRGKCSSLIKRACTIAALLSGLSVAAVNVHALSCSVSENSWNDGYVITVTVNNNSNVAISAWDVELNYQHSPNVLNSWNANISVLGNTLTVSNASWNGSLPAGQSVMFGLIGKHNNNFVVPSCSAVTASSSTPSSIATSYSNSSTAAVNSGVNSSSYTYNNTSSYTYNNTSGLGVAGVPSTPVIVPPPTPIVDPEIGEEETYFYLSYDDSASTAPRDLTFAALEYGLIPSASYGRAYEFLNAETFEHFSPQQVNPFDISMGLMQSPQSEIPISLAYEGDMYVLGINISGPTLTKAERKNVVLTMLVDISGSMGGRYASETRTDLSTLLDVAKHGLTSVVSSLKEGDVVNLVTFESSAKIVLTDWVFDSEDTTYTDAVNNLNYRGSTNLNAGINLAYDVANRSYDATKANRVIILTDAYANTGEIDPEIIADHTVINGMEGILFSGIGIGAKFNEAFLNELTDIGKSTYSAMVTPADAERIFTDGFMRFVDHAVENIQFRLDYPQSLDQLKSASEEISTDVSKVSTVNYAYNSSQFFFEIFNAETGVDTSDTITLTVTYDGDSGERETVIVEKSLADLISENTDQLYAAAAVTTLANLVAGDISCEAVLASGFYQKEISSEVFLTYITAITDLCLLDLEPVKPPIITSTSTSTSTSSTATSGSTSSARSTSYSANSSILPGSAFSSSSSAMSSLGMVIL